MANKVVEKDYIPPTYLHNMKYHLEKNGRSNVNDRDRRLLQYIRSLQELRQKSGIYKFLSI